jgi:rhodanese-related sulfurtransferase
MFFSILAQAVPRTITANELRRIELTKDPELTIIDVRPAADYAKGHIQGAKNVISSAVQRAGLQRNAHIVVYCSEAECPLSSGAANSLIADGYPNVELLAGGFNEWIKRGYPVQTETNSPAIEQNFARTHAKDARGTCPLSGAQDERRTVLP